MSDSLTQQCSRLYVLLDVSNRKHVIGVYTTRGKARQKQLRLAARQARGDMTMYNWTLKSNQAWITQCMQTLKMALAMYRIVPVTHLDPHKPIYVLQCANYAVYGKPRKYLIQSLRRWKRKYAEWYSSKEANDTDWQQQCTRIVNH